VPVLVNTTFHPNWQRADGAPVYAATPFAMLTFIDQTTELNFARSRSEQLALVGSAVTLAALCCFVAAPLAARLFTSLLSAQVARSFKWTNARKLSGD
jgi:hypothetical protein